MITRSHVKGDAPSTAVYSDCEKYRYSLTRVWCEDLPKLCYVMLNPSKATEIQNDPTIERCERRARTLGYGGFCATNIFAWRETDPRKLRKVISPIGTENDNAILEASSWADTVIAAWGTHGAHMSRGAAVETLLRNNEIDLFHLGISKAGHPKHPLYIAYAEVPRIWLSS